MKSLRRAFLGNQEYHHNLLGEEFDTLVEEATEKSLTRPSEEANRTVIQAISDPNTGMELTPGSISQELRKPLRSAIAQKQWLATVLIRDVLRECHSQLQPVLTEILEAVSVVATMDTRIAPAATKNAKQVALEILESHGAIGNRALRTATGAAPTQSRRRLPSASSSSEPQKSLALVGSYAENCKNHCEALRGLADSGEVHSMTASLIEELREEVKQMRKILAKAVEQLSNHTGDQIEKAISSGFEAIDAADKVLQRPVIPERAEETTPELTFRDMAPVLTSSSRSFDFLGEPTDHKKENTSAVGHQRSRSLDNFGLDALEDGLRQMTPRKEQLHQKRDDDDPFLALIEERPTPPSSAPHPQRSNGNPFSSDPFFSF